VITHAKLGQFGYFLAAMAVLIRRARWSCSISISVEELLLSTELMTMDSRRAKERYPVVQILSTTSY